MNRVRKTSLPSSAMNIRVMLMTSPASSKLNGTKLLIDLSLVHSDNNYPKSKPQETRLTSEVVTEEPKMNKLFELKVVESWLNS